MTRVDELAAWLLEQIQADETAARRCTYDDALSQITGWIEYGGDDDAEAHFQLHQPPRVIADCTAVRAVITLYTNALAAHRFGSLSQRNRIQDEAAVDVLGAAVRALAGPYSDRPGYRPEWSDDDDD